MGLDSVELVLQVEDTFGISIPDEEAEHCLTVGGLYNIVIGKLRPAEEGCLSNSAFYKLRKAMIDEFNYPRKEIRPNALLHDFFPKENRRNAWKSLQKRINLQLPGLHRPTLVHVGILTSSLLLGFLVGYSIGSFFISLITFFITLIFGYFTTPSLATEIPLLCVTIGDTANSILKLNFNALQEEKSRWHKKEVWVVLKSIISDILGVDAKDIVPEANFVKDLGLD